MGGGFVPCFEGGLFFLKLIILLFTQNFEPRHIICMENYSLRLLVTEIFRLLNRASGLPLHLDGE